MTWLDDAAIERARKAHNAVILTWPHGGRQLGKTHACMVAAILAAVGDRAVVPREQQWNFDMSKAPKEGTLLQLLILQGDHNCGFDDSHVTVTMGFNMVENDGIDEWKFPGWSWTHDCIIEQGHGTPFAWALMLEAPPLDDPRVIAAEHEYGPKTDG